ncbi:hypothetical protein QWA_18554 [Alcaligenes faecalis subsp. faecalis NCIB 8687]|nr:hypothetical protein QWA_18554 [Alcaligenes faecalis subsp. faecalis NCIB 8687]
MALTADPSYALVLLAALVLTGCGMFKTKSKDEALKDLQWEYHVKVHDGAHRVLGVAHGFNQLRTLFIRQAALHGSHHIGRRLGSSVSGS